MRGDTQEQGQMVLMKGDTRKMVLTRGDIPEQGQIDGPYER